MTATDPTAAALLRAILADPADDLPRLAYADWLEENGDPARAEFVRVQVELARRKKSVSDESTSRGRLLGYDHGGDYEDLRRRERDLLTRESIGLWFAWPGCPAVRAQFTAPGRFAAYRVGPHAFAALFARGFVSGVRCPLADWLDHGPAVVRAHPVERVTLSDREPDATGGGRWYWAHEENGNNDPESSLVPDGIFWELEGNYLDDPDERLRWYYFDSRETAVSSLSATALAWAKSAPVRPA